MSRTYRRGWKPTQSWAKKLANRKFRSILKRFDKKNGGHFPCGNAYKIITHAAYDICDYGGGWNSTPDAQWHETQYDKFRGCVYPDGKWEIGHDEIYKWTIEGWVTYYCGWSPSQEPKKRYYKRDVYDRVSRPYLPKDHKRNGKLRKKFKNMANEKELDK